VLVRILPFALFAMVVLACTPGQAAPDPGTSAEPVVLAATVDPRPAPIGAAEAILGEQVNNSGWIESVVRMEYTDGILVVVLDRGTSTLSQLDAYTQMCRALSHLIASEANPEGIAAVQFFKADGTPMVGTNAADTNCVKF
jgi:hypothetical protein